MNTTVSSIAIDSYDREKLSAAEVSGAELVGFESGKVVARTVESRRYHLSS